MIINHNMSAINANRQMSANQSATAKSTEKLSSGLRINRAADDAAGLAISEKMRAQVAGLNQASRNAQDGISLIQTAEGALNESHSMLQRIRELSVQAENGTNTAQDREAIQSEISELITEIDDTADKTEYNTQKLLNGNAGIKVKTEPSDFTKSGIKVDVSNALSNTTYALEATGTKITLSANGVSQEITVAAAGTVAAGTELNFDKLGIKITTSALTDFTAANNKGDIVTDTTQSIKLQVGANATKNETISLSIGNMSAKALGSGANDADKVKSIDVTDVTQTHAKRTEILDAAIKSVSEERAKLGAKQNRLEHTINNLGTSSENLTAAESRVRDVDMAEEMMEFTKNNVLSQASQAMLAQAKALPNQVLSLLQ